jgi:hypothetical protein
VSDDPHPSSPRSTGPIDLLPNLGAEEGDDWSPYQRQPAVRVAAHLWCLLFGRDAKLWRPSKERETDPRPESSVAPGWSALTREECWPDSLGPAPSVPAFQWLAEAPAYPTAWFNTPGLTNTAQDHFSAPLSGASPECVGRVHDKAFAIQAANRLGLTPRALEPLVEVLEPSSFKDPDALIRHLDQRLRAWPAWTGHNFTLKPRLGSSGRGRVGGRNRVDTPAVRGALPRLVKRGGAIFEPWLDRVGDYSVSLHLPGPDALDSRPTILGSLEIWNSPSGVYKGHCGEFDSRGRVFSGDSQDETFRADAAGIAAIAAEKGFSGPCGLDGMRYRQGNPGDDDEVLRLRSVVEFNARPTMGLVTIGLVRRALPLVREGLELSPGDRCGFALGYRDPGDREWIQRIRARLDGSASILDLGAGLEATAPSPVLIFAPSLQEIRAIRADLWGA